MSSGRPPGACRRVWALTPAPRKLVSLLILGFALVGGLAGSLSALRVMFQSELSAPCYWAAFSAAPRGPQAQEMLAKAAV